MHISIRQPRGIVPSSNGCNLPPEFAQVALNIDLTREGWVPWRAPETVIQFQESTGTAHVHNCCWAGVASEQANYIEAGTCGRTFLSAPGEYPVVSDDFCEFQWERLGFPVPSTPEVCALESKNCGPFNERVRYKLVFSNGCDDGPGSMPSEPVMLNEKGTAVVSVPTHVDPCWGITEVKVYRLISTWDPSAGFLSFEEGINPPIADVSTDSDYFYVGSVPLGESEFCDNFDCREDLLMTDDFYPPVKGLVLVGETLLGSLVGYEGKNVWFSERNAYWAYPRKARHNFPEEVKCVGVCQNTVIVVTESRVYLVEDNVDCEDATCRPVIETKETFQYCGRAQCISFANGIFFVAQQGLYFANTEGAVRLVSELAFGKASWSLLDPNQIRLGIGCEHLFLSTDQVSYAWPLRFDEQGSLPADLSTLSFRVDQWLNDEHGHLYFMVDNAVYSFNTGVENMTMQWEQVDIRWHAPARASAIRGDYEDKKLRRGNKLLLKKGIQRTCTTTKANKSTRLKNTLSDCFSAGVHGCIPMCTLHYGSGLTNLTTETRNE